MPLVVFLRTAPHRNQRGTFYQFTLFTHFVSYHRHLSSSTREARRSPFELQATPNYRQPSYRPCTWHCFKKRRGRFKAPSTHIYPQHAAQLKMMQAAACGGLYCSRRDTSNLYRHNMQYAPNMPHAQLCPLSTFIIGQHFDQYAEVKVGGRNQFMAKGPVEFMK